MAIVEMYTTTICGWCVRARRLLEARGVATAELELINVDFGREVMVERTGRTSVPQVLIGGEHVGGFDDLAALDRAGELIPMLERAREAAGSRRSS